MAPRSQVLAFTEGAFLSTCDTADLLVFSHKPWDFIYDRPQHILSRYGKHRRVYYFEEPVFGMSDTPRIHIKETNQNVLVVVPHIPSKLEPIKIQMILAELVDELIYEEDILDFTLWYYTPAALEFSRHLNPISSIYDCLDDLSDNDTKLEKELLEKVDLVFTESEEVFKLKNHLHHYIHLIPGSVDYAHFSQARKKLVEPDDQIHIPHPRIGFYGLIDKRIDWDLISEVARLKPEYQFIFSGPMIDQDKSALPTASNIHLLNKKNYYALPLYLAGWDCTMVPYHLNEPARKGLPSNILEFLAAGRAVVSTNLHGINRIDKIQNLIHVADSANSFGKLIDHAIKEGRQPEWLDQVDQYLRDINWENTFLEMADLELTLTMSNDAFSEIADGQILFRPLEFNRLNL